MPFVSPRFSGDTVLEEILNDPDTGTKKLGPGSPASSVEKVQQVLFDLGWPQLNVPPITDASTFVVGAYGPATTQAVLRYKTHYDIHFPPSDPPGRGLIDGFAGPRTLQKLDGHIALLDDGAAAIATKALDLEAQGITVQLDTAIGLIPLLDTRGVAQAATIDGSDGFIAFKRDIGAHEVHGNILLEFGNQGGFAGRFGFPTSDEHGDGPGTRRSDFERGSLRLDVQTGNVSVVGTLPRLPDPGY
jgi:hypothetical protein